MMVPDHYALMADLFDYPDPHYRNNVAAVYKFLIAAYPSAANDLSRFLELLPVQDVKTMQGLFTHTFDVQAITTLDIGYVLFGDDYKRGELLANLNREHREADNDCGTELADHLPNILRLMGKLTEEELLEELVQEIVGPAIKTMISEFKVERIEEKNKAYLKHYKTLIEAPVLQLEISSLYQFALKSLYLVLKQDFSLVEKITPETSVDFLASVQRENEIEEDANNLI